MTSLPSSAGGPYGLRDIRSLYPAVTENHLRYLEKWGLVRQLNRPRDRREYSFADLLTIKQAAAELERTLALLPRQRDHRLVDGNPLAWRREVPERRARGDGDLELGLALEQTLDQRSLAGATRAGDDEDRQWLSG